MAKVEHYYTKLSEGFCYHLPVGKSFSSVSACKIGFVRSGFVRFDNFLKVVKSTRKYLRSIN
ncbi:MAG: hypothetical protein HQK71_00195 [Desulfamplus sp.]|nr:hypothetical protein [Desulfamplus sp.]